MQVGIYGAGAIGLGCAAWVANRGHSVTVHSPRGSGHDVLRHAPLQSTGVLESRSIVQVADDARHLAELSDVILIAVPANGHRSAADALIPHLRSGQVVLVSSMASLSSLYFYEESRRRGIAISVASFGTTALTGRRLDSHLVRIQTRRSIVGVSCLPNSDLPGVLDTCRALFGGGFIADQNTLATSLSNVNPLAHPPLVLFNWTRVERIEAWSQYHYMTPRVSAVIVELDAERQRVAAAFGVQLRPIEDHFQRSFNVQTESLAEIAAELHQKRGGWPPGPTEVQTRYLTEDVPYGLFFIEMLGQIAGIPTPAIRCTVQMSSLISGETFETSNNLIPALGLASETVDGLLRRV